ncbi:MAG TPA: peroxiredoxin [Anaeromyxobacter sp.]|nr:peroxiredoxin [Anaeromyxobacter sp.]
MPPLLDPAPPFHARAVMPDGEARDLALDTFRGRWLVLAFYPRDFTRVCPTEIRELSKRAREFAELGAAVVAASVDDLDTHRRWIAEVLGPIAVPLAADPTRENARAWGALLEREGVAARATFVVDPDGVMRHAAFYDLAVGRSISETLRVLEALRAGGPRPAEWRPGDPTLGK